MSNLSIRYRKTAFKVHICISSLVPIAPPPHLNSHVWSVAPETISPPGVCVCVKGSGEGGRKKDRGSLGQGRG